MIPDNIKTPPTVSVRPEEVQQLDNFLKRANPIVGPDGNLQIILSKRQWKLINTISSTFLWIVTLLSVKRIGIGIIRKVLNISISKEKDNADDDQDNDSGKDGSAVDGHNDDVQAESSNDAADTDKEEDIPSSKAASRQNHDGQRTSEDMKDVTFCDHFHPELKKGDPCPEASCTGRVYPFLRDGKVREIITFDFTPPFRPTAHRMHDVRCNMCLTVFKATLPEYLIKNGALEKGRYLYPALAALTLFHYGMGMPMYRLDQFQSLVGERFPESTQFDKLEMVANIFKNLTDAMIINAASGFMIQGDDVTNRVRSLIAELKERRSDGQIVLREGIHTSILIATTFDGHFIPVLKTGIIHFGELLDEILVHRPADLPIVRLVCDGSKVNQATVVDYEVGGCWQHAREYFVKAMKGFPQEAGVIKDLIKNIFKVDRETHELDAAKRLEHLKEYGLPIVESIKDKVDAYINDKIALPKSELGVALQYFNNQYERFLLPFETMGIPIHNNISEWCTYLVVRLLTNSKAYKNQVGAGIGDRMIMLILFCYLNLINPYSYILYCLQHQEEMRADPEAFFPWKLKNKLEALPKHKQMRFWSPPPPDYQGMDP